ncbi:SpoIIE family protein phosphatase [Streptomyces cinerochromogenes]|uniref:SpoIIE family protein phosphatase n=1 Tax=Streptomyces cinerochromogenes TaxID=66422 RepID=UPI0033BD0554
MSQYRSVLRTVAAAGLLVLVDPQAGGTCAATTAGHLPPLVIRPNGSSGLMPPPAGPPIGTELGAYETTTCAFEPGSVLLQPA